LSPPRGLTRIALRSSLGRTLTLLSEPLLFFAYPFLAATSFDWAWAHYRPAA
jgi:hypothetical protein